MNVRFLTYLAAAVFAVAGWHAATTEPLTFARGGTITVEGTSNIHGWTCTAGSFTGSADGAAAATGITGLSALTLTVPVSALECRNGTMNTKLREALHATTSPSIRFVLSNATVSTPRNGRFAVTANGTLSMAGQSRTTQVTAQGQVLADGRYRFTGAVPVTMSQFGIAPPTAMMGAMRVGDRVTVRFDVTLAR